jgi:hypothetical protein
MDIKRKDEWCERHEKNGLKSLFLPLNILLCFLSLYLVLLSNLIQYFTPNGHSSISFLLIVVSIHFVPAKGPILTFLFFNFLMNFDYHIKFRMCFWSIKCQNMKTNKEIVLCKTMPNNPNKSIYDCFFFQK